MARIKKTNIEDENKILKDELNQLKAMMSALLNRDKIESTIISNDEEEHKSEDEDDYVEIKPTKNIHVTSLVYGICVLKNEKGITFKINDFGEARSIRFEDLESINNINKNIFKQGWIYIKDADVRKALYLEDDYKKIIDKNTIENFINLKEDKMSHIFETASNIQIETVIENITKGILSDDRKYYDRNKLAVVDKLIEKRYKGKVSKLDELAKEYQISSETYGKQEE